MIQTCQVSRIWREYHAFLALSHVHPAFLKIDDFHTFSGFSSRIHPIAQYPQSLTFWFVISFQVMLFVRTYVDREHHSRTMSY